MSSAGASLQGSFSGASGDISKTGFVYGTDASGLESNGTEVEAVNSDGRFSALVEGLAAGTKYYYKAFAVEYNQAKGTDEYRYGDAGSFTTAQTEELIPTGWLELPAEDGNADYVGTFYSSGTSDANRNYTYNYSYHYFASLWVAYPLTYANTQGTASHSGWDYNDSIDDMYEVNIVDNSYVTMYGESKYSRGHQIPNADRKDNTTMNSQTYITTNQTPQIQNKFNGSIWGSLETAVRGLLSSGSSETLYIVTGPAYRKAGGNETIDYLTAARPDAYPESLPVANYYWKAILRVKQNSRGEVTGASAIGFWFDHKEYEKTDSYLNYAVSVNQIEEWTGFDLFTHLPNSLEAKAESNTDWNAFKSFNK